MSIRPRIRHKQFQFTHPGGVRPTTALMTPPMTAFQFTHPGGVRRFTSPSWVATRRFQFTHPGGVRPLLSTTDATNHGVSIHAPGRGATLPTPTD